MSAFRPPLATYRLQLNSAFRFQDAGELIPYLRRLGITDLYTSPVLAARRGSTHGYDIVDPTQLNPELGAAEEFDALAARLRHNSMGLILDIVPNHMAASSENPWWSDFLEHGLASPYADFFEIIWEPGGPGAGAKVLLPVLGKPYGEVLEGQELQLILDENGFAVRYYDWRFPLDPKSYAALLEPDVPAFHGLLHWIEALPGRNADDPAARERRRHMTTELKRELWAFYQADPQARASLDQRLRLFKGVRGDPASFDPLENLLADQVYWLAFWRAATEKINYRRFFDISDLIGLRTERPEVFEATHRLVVRLAREGTITGLRADHIDGLHDPRAYLDRLQQCVAAADRSRPARGFYVVVEKILIGDEPLPDDWAVCGTTGYDFLNLINGVFIDPRGIEALQRIYASFTGLDIRLPNVVYEQKKRVIEELFAGEVRALADQLGSLSEGYRHTRYLSRRELDRALLEVTACFPVYRTYIRDFEVPARDRPFLDRTLQEAQRRSPPFSTPVLEFLRQVLLLDFPRGLAAEQCEAWRKFVMRWQQFTGPVMAKGLEDTACYVYNRLISLNEVGSDGQPVEGPAFHDAMRARQERWPHTLNATSTHDTKRSLDVRARINVLSELPTAWDIRLRRWSRWNRPKKPSAAGRPVPDANMEVFLYQTLLGGWPLDPAELPDFRERLKDYLTKAAREAKFHTSWVYVNQEYEQALLAFVDALLEESPTNLFLPDFHRFQRRIAWYGALGSLAQILLKVAAPGVPDFYQGTELWDLSLADPDNRRPVDYARRQELLEEVAGAADPAELLAHWEDGRIKLWLIGTALGFRAAEPELFRTGEYLPLVAGDPRADHVVAFLRRSGARWCAAAAPRFCTRLAGQDKAPVGKAVWKDTALALPAEAPALWRNVLTGETLSVAFRTEGPFLYLRDVFAIFPLALLEAS